jgi:hypothetical protein
MSSFRAFQKAAPCSLALPERPRPDEATYKYLLRGKGCTLGVLFEDSTHVYFEWLTEESRPVAYGREVRYKARPKRVFARLMAAGVWQPEPCSGDHSERRVAA